MPSVYIIQVCSKHPTAHNWRNTGREYYTSPVDAKNEKLRLLAEYKDKDFRVMKFVPAGEVNGAGERVKKGLR